MQLTASAQLPGATHPNLVRFGYYFVNERYGDDTAAVWPYTNLYVAIADGYDSNNPDWQTPFAASLQKAAVNHKAIYLGMPGANPSQASITVDAVLDVAQPYWGQVAYVDVLSEPAASFTSTDMENRINDISAKIAARGLSPRPFGATFDTAILTTNAILATNLSFANIEAYVAAPGDPDPQVNINTLNNYLATAKSRVHNAGKQIFLTGQAYDRNGTWTNMTTLEALQRSFYLNAYADPDVVGILLFAYGRTGGTRDHPVLQQAHREIGSVMNISPAMSIDVPSPGATVTQPFALAGWAIDRAAAPGSGTGVNTLHVWAYPAGGAPPVFAGVASYGDYRPDVGAAYGAQFTYSGFAVSVSGLALGQYTFAVFPYSTVGSNFTAPKLIVLNVF
jgi:hypothetical protein